MDQTRNRGQWGVPFGAGVGVKLAAALSTVAVALAAVCAVPSMAHAAPKAKKATLAKAAPRAAVRTPARAKAVHPVAAGRLVMGRASRAQLLRGAAPLRTRLVLGSSKRTTRYAAHSLPLVAPEPPRQSFGQLAGLHATHDSLDLRSSVALVVDQDTREVLLSKNDKAVLPIASITKLMTGLLVSEARLPMGELITITQDDLDTEKGTRSRLSVGATLTRGELMHLALMSSENRAAHALGRTYPGGLDRFVTLMNLRAQQLGMRDTQYVEPTGLSSRNQSSAQDLATLVNVASRDPMLRSLSTSPEHVVAVGNRVLQFNNTNRLVKNPLWDIGLQKTGYISEAGQCLVMQTKVAGRKLIMVFLDSAGKLSRLGDAERVRRWVEASSAGIPIPHS